MRTLAERIVYVRKILLRLKQASFAKALEVTGGAVSNWERGGPISGEHLRAIASLARISLDWLINNTGELPRPGLSHQIDKKLIASILVEAAERQGLVLKELPIEALLDTLAKATALQQAAGQPKNQQLPASPALQPVPSKSKKSHHPK